MVNDINVVPYIDVMLVLLVIFMVTAPLLPPTQIELPTVGSSKQVDNEYVEVLIQADNELRVRRMNAADPSERTIALGDLTAVVREMRAQPTTPVVISADNRYATSWWSMRSTVCSASAPESA
ncbi:MAG: biopolymer transporter ExbD [Burkholderiaceae bacterium]